MQNHVIHPIAAAHHGFGGQEIAHTGGPLHGGQGMERGPGIVGCYGEIEQLGKAIIFFDLQATPASTPERYAIWQP